MAKVDITYPGDTVVKSFTALVRQPVSPSSAPPIDIGLVEINHPTKMIPGPPGPPGPGVIVSDTPPADPYDGMLWWESDTGVLWAWYEDPDSSQWVQISGGTGSKSSVIIADTAPTGAENGQLWWSSANGNLYCWYNDGDSAQWVQVNTNSGLVTPQLFGAVADGIADDTAAIQAAVNFLATGDKGGRLYFPKGKYLVSDVITVSGTGITFQGDARITTEIIQSDLTKGILYITGQFFRLESMSFNYPSAPSAGDVIDARGSYSHFNDFIIRRAWHGVRLQTGVAQKLTQFEIFNYEDIGIWVAQTSDIYASQFVLNAGDQVRGRTGGIVLQDKIEGAMFVDGDVLLGVRGLYTIAATNAPGGRPAYCSFYSVLFDSGARESLIDKVVETSFTDCWFSNGRTGAGFDGAWISNCDSLRFIGTRFFNCGGNGVVLQSTSTRISFTSCSFESNSQTAGSGVKHGFTAAAGSQHFSLINCKASNYLFPGGQQGYGIFINSGSDNFQVIGCNLTGNVTGGIAGGGAATVKYVHSNIGVSDAWTTYTPTITPSAGAITTVGATTGRYQRVGNTMHLQIKFTITTNGTGSGTIRATVPLTTTQDAVGAGFNYSTGKASRVILQAATAYVAIANYDNTYPVADGHQMVVSITCEI